MGHKELLEDGKTFTRCYTITLKFWDEFNAYYVLLYFSSYRSIKMWHLYFKNIKKIGNKAVHEDTKTFSILRNILLWYLKKFVHVLFCVFKTNLDKALYTLCKLSEWISNLQMTQRFNTMILIAWLTQKTEGPKCNKGNFTFAHTYSKCNWTVK